MESVILKMLGAFVAGLFLGIKLRGVITKSKAKQEQLTETISHPIAMSQIPEQEIWNVVTNYGKYPDVWELYRSNGWLDAIKSRNELDLAVIKSLVSYFETMPEKIRHYHDHHQASKEEAEIIANYYKNTAKIISNVQTQSDLKNLIIHIKDLKNKVGRYKHKESKYRWSEGLDKKVLKKLEKIN